MRAQFCSVTRFHKNRIDDSAKDGCNRIDVGMDTFCKPKNGEQRRDVLLVLMSVLL